MQAKNAEETQGLSDSSAHPIRSADAGAATTPGDAAGRPLLIDTMAGEDRAFSFSAVGQGLMTIAVIALLGAVLALLLSGPSLAGGWDGVWYVPRGEIFFVLPISIALFVIGGVLYLFGRRNGTD